MTYSWFRTHFHHGFPTSDGALTTQNCGPGRFVLPPLGCRIATLPETSLPRTQYRQTIPCLRREVSSAIELHQACPTRLIDWHGSKASSLSCSRPPEPPPLEGWSSI